MDFSFTGGSSFRRWAIASAIIILLVFGLFGHAYQRCVVHVQYGENISPKVRDTVEALIRGEMIKPEVSEEELRRRQTYATERFGGTGSDRGRFYICVGSPDEIESQMSAPRQEIWIYKNLGFTVTFTDFQQNRSNIPPGVSPSLWIPLSPNSGIALRDAGSGSTVRGIPVARGTIMARVGGVWTKVSLEAEAEMIPVGK